MKAVFRHELSSHFTSLSAYVFAAFLLLFAGIYTMVYNLKNALVNFEYVPASMAFIFLIIVPILTMRTLSEEKKQKTDQLLYSLPLSMTRVVLGKYLAMLVLLGLSIVPLCIYPLILKHYGNVYLPACYCSILGFFLLGAALIAVGMFISSVTESQAVAAGLCFVVLLLNYFLSSLADYVSDSAFASLMTGAVLLLLLALIVYLMTKNGFAAGLLAVFTETALAIVYTLNSTLFEGVASELLNKLSLFEQFYTIVDGVMDLRVLVFLISVAGVFLFLSVQSMEKRRWSE